MAFETIDFKLTTADGTHSVTYEIRRLLRYETFGNSGLALAEIQLNLFVEPQPELDFGDTQSD